MGCIGPTAVFHAASGRLRDFLLRQHVNKVLVAFSAGALFLESFVSVLIYSVNIILFMEVLYKSIKETWTLSFIELLVLYSRDK